MSAQLEPLKQHEWPTWLVAMVDQRVAFMREQMGPAGWEMAKHLDVLMTPLTEPVEDATPAQHQRWDHSCDKCGKYCPDEGRLHYAYVEYKLDGVKVIIFFGACTEHATWRK